jgi:hypothetical protein
VALKWLAADSLFDELVRAEAYLLLCRCPGDLMGVEQVGVSSIDGSFSERLVSELSILGYLHQYVMSGFTLRHKEVGRPWRWFGYYLLSVLYNQPHSVISSAL